MRNMGGGGGSLEIPLKISFYHIWSCLIKPVPKVLFLVWDSRYVLSDAIGAKPI